jgi:hypothetical protein
MPTKVTRLPAEEEPARIAIALPADSLARIDEIGKRIATGSRGRTIQVVVDTLYMTRPQLAEIRKLGEQFAQAKGSDAQQVIFLAVIFRLSEVVTTLSRLVGTDAKPTASSGEVVAGAPGE